MSRRDYYLILEVERGVDPTALKSAFRKKAGELHPDRHPHLDDASRKAMEERFKEVAEAYQILSDPQKRATYDRFGHDAASSGAPQFQGFEDLGGMFSEVFEGFFGGGRASRGGADLRAELALDLEEAARGKQIELDVPAQRTCTTCKGSGARSGSKPQTCKQCGGRGRVRINQGFFSVAATCPSCHGRGEVVQDPCPDCRGAGRTRQTRKVKVSVPAGIEDGMQVRLRGEGESGEAGSAAGDLYVLLRVREHAIFNRDGADLFCELPLSFAQAALGAELDVPTLDGPPVKLKVPSGTQTGKEFRVKSKGMPPLQGRGQGDLRVSVRVDTPQSLSSRQKELLEEFAKEGGEAVTRKKSIVEKAKKIFEG